MKMMHERLVEGSFSGLAKSCPGRLENLFFATMNGQLLQRIVSSIVVVVVVVALDLETINRESICVLVPEMPLDSMTVTVYSFAEGFGTTGALVKVLDLEFYPPISAQWAAYPQSD